MLTQLENQPGLFQTIVHNNNTIIFVTLNFDGYAVSVIEPLVSQGIICTSAMD